MGLISSKFAQRPQDFDEEDETGSIPSTPILTPKSKVKLNSEENTENGALDPRSPSRHISRTPIELVSLTTPKQQSPTLHIATNGAVVMETPLKSHLILGIDPRSPSVEVNRTPIIVDNTSPKLPQQLKNKNLDKVRNGEMKSFTSKTEIARTVANITMQFTPKNKRADLNKRKSLVLLETNIDYTETHLDDVIREKYPVAPLENLSPTDVCDRRSPTTEFTRTPGELPKTKIAEDNQDDQLHHSHLTVTPQKCNKDVECTGESYGDHAEEFEECNTVSHIVNGTDNIEKDKHVFADDEPENAQIKSEDSETKFEGAQSLEQINDASVILPKTPSDLKLAEAAAVLEDVEENVEAAEEEAEIEAHTVSETIRSDDNVEIANHPKNLKSVSEPILGINLTADVKELDKKLTNLIYEDDELVVCPKVVKCTGKIMQSRTPLGQRQYGSENTKSTKLKVSDKPRKSQIPLFKDKKIKVQCENTPPKSMRQGAKGKKPQWDLKNDTLVI